MALTDWIKGSIRDVRNQGLKRGIELAAKELEAGYYRRTLPDDYGQNVYERDWDILLIVDACRMDLMREAKPKYDFINKVGIHESPGTMSLEWMENTFVEDYQDEISETAYVSGNPFTECIDRTQFQTIDEVWKYGWEDEYGVVTPETMTDRAIDVWRTESPDKMIVHYMQPHFPSRHQAFHDGYEVKSDKSGLRSWTEKDDSKDVWKNIRNGVYRYNEVWEAYLDNLEWVLDSIELFLNNVDADDVVITSDHGNAVGEHGFWGHPRNIPIDALYTVPWVTTTAEQTDDYAPTVEVEEIDTEVEDRLEDLGYM